MDPSDVCEGVNVARGSIRVLICGGVDSRLQIASVPSPTSS